MPKIFLTDVDGVVLHWGPAFNKFVRHGLGWKPKGTVEQFHYVEEWLNITEEKATEMILEFHRSEYFKHLPPFHDAPQYLKKMSDEGWKFIAVTAAGEEDGIRENRIHNLKVHYPDVFVEVVCVDPDTTKKHILREFEPTFWVDDSRRHVLDGVDCGHTSFFMDRFDDVRQQVMDHPEVTSVVSWKQIYEAVNNNAE